MERSDQLGSERQQPSSLTCTLIATRQQALTACQTQTFSDVGDKTTRSTLPSFPYHNYVCCGVGDAMMCVVRRVRPRQPLQARRLRARHRPRCLSGACPRTETSAHGRGMGLGQPLKTRTSISPTDGEGIIEEGVTVSADTKAYLKKVLENYKRNLVASGAGRGMMSDSDSSLWILPQHPVLVPWGNPADASMLTKGPSIPCAAMWMGDSFWIILTNNLADQ